MKNTTRTSLFRQHGYTTDSGMLRRMAAEDEQAWIDFDAKYRSMIRAVAKQRGIAEEDCDDLIQEVMVICCRRIGSFFYDRRKGHFRSYLFSIIKNAAWQMRRKKEQVPPEGIPDYEEGIDRIFMEQYERFLVETALKLLRDRVNSETYSAFEMLEIQQLPVAEVSQITRKTRPALYLIRHRCLRILRQCIEEIPEAADRIHSKGSSSKKA